MNDLNSLWLEFVKSANDSPRLLFAGFLCALTLLLFIITITVFTRLRTLWIRYRQLAENFESLSTLVEQRSAHLENEIHSLAFKYQALSATPPAAMKEGGRERPAALMREELASLQLDLREIETDSAAVPEDAN